jgi:transcriptional regulator of arginine metabolism
MKSRTQRILAIRRIIGKEAITSQDELLSILKQEGYDVTQATLSRDLKFLEAGKIPDKEKGYIYVLPREKQTNIRPAGLGNFPLNGFISLEFARDLAVIKTHPGYAQSIAAAIDGMDAYEIMGTIAGDDTILLIPRDDVGREDIRNALALLFPIEQLS